MSDYNNFFKNFMSSIYSEKYLSEAPYNEVFKLTKRDKFIEVTWLLYKAYLEKMLRSIGCMHIKSGLSWELRVMRLGIEKSHV
jgi:hypothetical protein